MIYIQDSFTPFISGAVFLLNLISILTPWLSFSANTPAQSIYGQTTPSADNSGSIYLYQTVGCSKYTSSVPPTSSQGVCSLITIGNLPQSLGYMKDAANVGMTFTILSLLANSISVFFTSLAAMKKLNLLFNENGHYKVRYAIIGSNLVVVLFNIIAFSSFSGLFNSKFGINTDALLIGFGGTQNRSWGYGGGFGLSIVVTILSGLISIAEYLHTSGRDRYENTMMNPMNHPHQSQTHQATV